ncbi:MAG: hypothetical protein ACU0C9_06895 [Paracoccaceae bacterium]
MTDFSKLASLRKLMLEMERSLGLQELSAVERDIYYAATDLSDVERGVSTNSLLDHALVMGVSRPTFFRALKSLAHKGYLVPSKTAGRGRYVVNPPRL